MLRLRAVALLFMLVIVVACRGPATNETAVATLTPIDTPTASSNAGAPPTIAASLIAVTETPAVPATQAATPPGSSGVPTPEFSQVTVYPSLFEIQTEEAAPGQEIKVQGSGGLIELKKPDGSPGGYIESARSFELYLDGRPVGSIQCYVNVCNGALVLPLSTGPGDHEISAEGGSSQTLKVSGTPTLSPETTGLSFALAIDAFPEAALIPDRYTCEGEDISPALDWGEPPLGTKSYALVMDDPDAPVGVWDHWVVFDLPSGVRGLPEKQPIEPRLSNGAIQGSNSWPSNNIGYRGPCPPSGPAHTYRFFLYAVDLMLDLPPGADKGEVLKALDGHFVAERVYTGRYQR